MKLLQTNRRVFSQLLAFTLDVMVLHSDLVENAKPAGIVPWALPHIFPAAVEELHVTYVGPVAFPENITIFFINGYCRIYIQSYCQG